MGEWGGVNSVALSVSRDRVKRTENRQAGEKGPAGLPFTRRSRTIITEGRRETSDRSPKEGNRPKSESVGWVGGPTSRKCGVKSTSSRFWNSDSREKHKSCKSIVICSAQRAFKQLVVLNLQITPMMPIRMRKRITRTGNPHGLG